MNNNLSTLSFKEMKLGLKKSFEIEITDSLVNSFAELSGDFNQPDSLNCECTTDCCDIFTTADYIDNPNLEAMIPEFIIPFFASS